MERLEPRALLDASATLVGGLLSVVAGPEKEVLQLTLNTATAQLVVSDSGKQIGQFASASVNQITINTGNANDRVRIAGNVLQPATLQAGNGNVDFEAGGGPTTFNVGNGNDKLVGGAAPSIFTAGNGADTIISGSGQDLIQVGSGKDRIFVRGNDVVIPTAPPGNYTLIGEPTSTPSPSPDPPAPPPVLTPGEVNTLLSRAAAATTSNDAIVVVVDREGNPLGVRVEGNVSTAITGNTGNLVFAIDGALAEARTGAFFANNDAPLTSRTIEFISQSTITQREVESNPSITNPNSTIAGPGLVAPVGVGGHFPPGINDTPQVDLFDIENTNRDSSLDVTTGNRFNVPSADIPPGQGLPFPDSYGVISGTEPNARPRGLGTLPGGIPIEINGKVVGGIGVFFPGTTGSADAENSSLSATFNPSKPDRTLEAEFIGLVAVGGSPTAFSVNHPAGFFNFTGPIGAAPALPAGFGLPFGFINLNGITLPIFGPGNPETGLDTLYNIGVSLGFGQGNPNSGSLEPVNTLHQTLIAGTPVPSGFLVTPHAGGGITAAQVTQIIDQGIAAASQIRSAIRLPFNTPAEMAFAVADSQGEVLGLYAEPDVTYFSIGVAVAKARNVAYYDNPSLLQPVDQVPGVLPGVAFTNRTFRYLAEPFFPEGINGQPPGPFSILNDGGVNPTNGLNVGPPLPASAFTSVMGFNAFHPDTNFRQPPSPNQNGVVFFPGSMPLYQGGSLIAGLGVSGDGVNQDDDITFFASVGFQPASEGVVQADQVTFHGVRLPFLNFNRNPILP